MPTNERNVAVPAKVRLFLVALLVFLMLLPVPVASAATLTPASGNGMITNSVPTVLQSADGTTILSLASTSSFTGTFTGTSVAHATCVVRASGQGICQGPEKFTGTVAGHPGTVDFFDVYTISGDAAQGRAVITGGTAALGGDVSFQGTGTNFTYAGRIIVP